VNFTLAVIDLTAFGQEHRANAAPIALQVGDTHAAGQRLETKGVEFAPETVDSGVCHQAYFADPDGNPLTLHHRYAPAAE
jgi:catechol 2,3-dioxygenase-like lactoylglutathione lyase family enzyme